MGDPSANLTRVALWGFGRCGHEAKWAIEQSEPQRYEIAAIFDRNFEELNARGETGLHIQDPNLVEELYARGEFEGVIISIANRYAWIEVAGKLNSLSVPVILCEAEYASPGQFEQDPFEYELVDSKGYETHIFKDLYLNQTFNSYTPFVFNAEGDVNAAFIHDYQATADTIAKLYRPHPFETVVRLQGDWCFPANIYSDNYWHFTYEVMPEVWCLEEAGYAGNYLLRWTPFAEELLGLAGIDLARVVWTRDLDVSTTYQFERLVHVAPDADEIRSTAPALCRMADAIIANLPETDAEYPERVFLKRTGTRRLLGADETLARYGFVAIDPGKLSVTEQVRYLNHARIAVSPHGANSTNSLYMRPGTAFIETFPINYVAPLCIYTMAERGVAYLQTVEVYGFETPFECNPEKDYRLMPLTLEMQIENAIKLTE